MTWPFVALVAVLVLFVRDLARQWVRMQIDARARVLPARAQQTIEVKVVGAEEMKRQLEALRDAAQKVNSAMLNTSGAEPHSYSGGGITPATLGTAMLGLRDKPEGVIPFNAKGAHELHGSTKHTIKPRPKTKRKA